MGDQEAQKAGLNALGDGGKGAGSVLRGSAPASSGESSSPAVPAPRPLALPQRVARRLLHVWFRLVRGMTLGVRAMVLDAEGRVFLVRHSYLPGWHLPGGGVEAGQSLLAALRMELGEEGNIVLSGDPVLFGVYHNHPAAPRDHVALFVVRQFRQTAPRLPDREIVECGFFPLDALPAGTTAGTRRRLREVLEGENAGETW